MYRLESTILEWAKRGSEEYLKLRKTGLGPIRAAFKDWLDKKQGVVPPKSPLGVAIRYTLNQWDVLGNFLEDANLSLDNNPAEAALRRVALGRTALDSRRLICLSTLAFTPTLRAADRGGSPERSRGLAGQP